MIVLDPEGSFTEDCSSQVSYKLCPLHFVTWASEGVGMER